MTPLIWTAAIALLAVAGLTAAYDQTERRREPSESCCPVCEVGGPGACGGAR